MFIVERTSFFKRLIGFVLVLLVGISYAYYLCQAKVFAREIVQNWVEGEAVNIQQGNLLVAISKNYRVLSRSGFIRGIVIRDLASRKNELTSTLFSVGEVVDFPEEQLVENEISIETDPFGRVSVAYLVIYPSKLAIIFSVYSAFASTLFVVFSISLSIIVGLFLWFLELNLKSQALLRETLIITAFEDLVSKSKPSDIVKTFSPGVAGTWSKLTEKLSHLTETEAKSRVLEEQSHLARQVAHDIRSPLSALNLVGKNLPEDFEGKDLILAASKRINRISEDLLEKSRGANTSFQPRLERILENSVPKPASVEELKRSIENLIVEKQACYPNISFLSNTCLDHSFSERKILNIDIVEIERTISNLLQNSIEATTNSRKPVVKVLLSNRGDNLRFDICDNGIGIPKDIISNLGKKPITAGKTKGNGLGLYHASQIAHKYKGNIAFLPIEVGSHIRFTLNSL